MMRWKNTRFWQVTACLAMISSGINGCRKDEVEQPSAVTTPLQFTVSFSCNDQPLLFDSLMYTNAAGNQYSVQKLEFYLSGFRVKDLQGTWHSNDQVFYVNARDVSTCKLKLKNIALTGFSALEFNTGVVASQNISGYLPATAANLNMAWPDMMGGGYHFLKLEGHFADSSSLNGFTMHLGRNENLVPVHLSKQVNQAYNVKLNMEVNEWFQNPYTFNLNKTNYTMGVDSLMHQLSLNGADVFSLK